MYTNVKKRKKENNKYPNLQLICKIKLFWFWKYKNVVRSLS